MKFVAEVDVMPLKELLDPQGKAVMLGLKNLGLHAFEDVRIGKHMKLTIEAATEAEAREKVETACKKLLSNQVMEGYSFSLEQA
jgi:phosphoribosylformylglycinamidine synthase